MDFLLVLPYYLVWHYGRAYFDIKSLWKNFLIFVFHFFSIPVLLRTLFSPWQRMHDGYGPQNPIFETLIFNTIMRVVGAVIRLVFILIGSLCLLACFVIGFVFLILWFLFPFIMLSMFSWGIKQIFI